MLLDGVLEAILQIKLPPLLRHKEWKIIGAHIAFLDSLTNFEDGQRRLLTISKCLDTLCDCLRTDDMRLLELTWSTLSNLVSHRRGVSILSLQPLSLAIKDALKSTIPVVRLSVIEFLAVALATQYA
jgi:hypothetical protein